MGALLLLLLSAGAAVLLAAAAPAVLEGATALQSMSTDEITFVVPVTVTGMHVVTGVVDALDPLADGVPVQAPLEYPDSPTDVPQVTIELEVVPVLHTLAETYATAAPDDTLQAGSLNRASDAAEACRDPQWMTSIWPNLG